jgi:hypothetical protein
MEGKIDTLIYPEATFEWDEEFGGVKKVWITWPDGRKESVNSLYSDDNVTNGIDRFYVILANDIEQTVVVKDKEYLELREKRKKLWKEFEKEREKIRETIKKKISRKKTLVSISFLALLTIPSMLFYFSKFRKRNI